MKTSLPTRAFGRTDAATIELDAADLDAIAKTIATTGAGQRPTRP